MIDRINLILQAKNITAKQFAEEIGVQPSGMSHILGGRNNPSLEFVNKVLRRYPEIDANWLLLGRGEMFAAHGQQPPKPSDAITEPTLFGTAIDGYGTEAGPRQPMFSFGPDSEPESPNPTDDAEKGILPQPEEAAHPIGQSLLSESQADAEANVHAGPQPPVEPMVKNDKASIARGCKRVERLVFIFSDGTFVDYTPSATGE